MFVGKKCPKFLEYGVKVSLKSLNVNISSFWQSIYISSKLNYLPPQAELLWVMFSVFIFLWICLENCLCLWNKLLKYITFTQTIYFIISVCDYFIHEHCQVRILSNFWENPISIKIPSCILCEKKLQQCQFWFLWPKNLITIFLMHYYWHFSHSSSIFDSITNRVKTKIKKLEPTFISL